MRDNSALRSSSRPSTIASARSAVSNSAPITLRGFFSVYGNVAVQSAKGKDVESSQFSFTAQQLSYITDNFIHLDHEERASASGGASYLWLGTRFNLDMIFGTGLRDDLPLVAPSPTLPYRISIPNGDHTPSHTQW